MLKFRRRDLLLTGSAAWLAPAAASAQQPGRTTAPTLAETAGTVRTTAGRVFGGGLLYPIQRGHTVSRNERIQTLEQSACDILLRDGSTLVIGADADLVLDDLVLDGEEMNGTLRTAKAFVRFLGAPRPKRLRVVTPLGTAGVRGTAFDLMTGHGATEIEVVEGTVAFEAPGRSLALAAPAFFRIEPGGLIPPDPKPSGSFVTAAALTERLIPSVARRKAAGEVRVEEIRDASGRVTGRLVVRPDGRMEGTDAAGNLRWRYDPQTDRTSDIGGRISHPGNQIRRLLGGQ